MKLDDGIVDGPCAEAYGQGTMLVIGIRLSLVGLLGWIGCWIATQHPLWPWLQLSGTVLCFAVTVLRPAWFAGMFPFLLVVGDAYPATGQLLFQEYDSLLLGAISGALLRTKQFATLEQAQAREWLPWIMWAISVGLGLAIGWTVLPANEWGDQLSLYFANTNSLRVAKGHAWGILFAVFLLTQRTTPESLTKYRHSFVTGVQCAALVVGIWVLLERWLFESIFDFSHEYRATGPFFSMHIGDHHLDAFIVLAFPLAWIGIDRFEKSLACLWASTLWASALTVLLLYAAIATMSRATIIIIMLQMLAIIILKAWPPARATSLPRIYWRSFFLVSASLGMVAVAALLGLSETAIRERFTHSENDWNTRFEHWKKAVDPTHFTLQQVFLGHGLGTFPTFMARSMELPIPPLRWSSDDGGKIEIRGGWPLYLDRVQWPASHDSQSIAMRITHSDSDGTPASIFASRCYQALLQSYELTEVEIAIPSDVNGQHFELELPAPQISSNSPAQRIWRPETLSISMHGRGIATLAHVGIDISNRLPTDISAKGSSPWIFTCDDLLVWRAQNAMVHTYFEQGILGIAGLLFLASILFPRRIQKVNPRTIQDGRMLSVSLIGVCLVATIGSLLDTPSLAGLILGEIACYQSLQTRSFIASLGAGR
jgi:hypothetical protein